MRDAYHIRTQADLPGHVEKAEQSHCDHTHEAEAGAHFTWGKQLARKQRGICRSSWLSGEQLDAEEAGWGGRGNQDRPC